jgi:hypothetical protein
MKTAANPPIVKFPGGADERSGGFRGWTFHVSAGEALASGAVSQAALQTLTEGNPPPLVNTTSNWRSMLAAVDCQPLAVAQPFAQLSQRHRAPCSRASRCRVRRMRLAGAAAQPSIGEPEQGFGDVCVFKA